MRPACYPLCIKRYNALRLNLAGGQFFSIEIRADFSEPLICQDFVRKSRHILFNKMDVASFSDMV